MTQIGGYSPETARMILDVVKYLKASGFVIDASRGNGQTIHPPELIYVRNDSGEEIPPFACMQSTGTVEEGGQNYIKVDKPVDVTGMAGEFLFNSIAPIPASGNNKYGVAQAGPVARMLTDGSTVTSGGLWSPEVDEWAVIPGALFLAIGADNIDDDVIKAYVKGPDMIVCKTPGGGIAAASSSVVSADCTVWFRSVGSSTLASTSATIPVYNLSSQSVAGSAFIVAGRTNIGYVVVWEDC